MNILQLLILCTDFKPKISGVSTRFHNHTIVKIITKRSLFHTKQKPFINMDGKNTVYITGFFTEKIKTIFLLIIQVFFLYK